MVGNIAYSLYKADKITFIETFKKEHGGQEPTEQDFQPFHDNACMDSNIARYKLQAVSILQVFLDDTLSSTADQIEEKSKNSHKEMLKEVVDDIKPKGFWYGILQSIVGAFAFMLLLCVLLFFLKFSETQYTFTFGGNGNAKIETNK